MSMLIIPLPRNAFKAHAAFFQYPRRRGIAVKHLSLYAVKADLVDGVMDGDLDGFLNAYLTQLATGELKK